MSREPITAETKILDALEAHPKVKEIFVKHGLPCHECSVAEVETIDAGARSEGLDAETIVEEINCLLEGPPARS